LSVLFSGIMVQTLALLRYAQESSWREDNRRVSNGDRRTGSTALALKRGKSVDFTGYCGVAHRTFNYQESSCGLRKLCPQDFLQERSIRWT
jgi:hypothetical protein